MGTHHRSIFAGNEGRWIFYFLLFLLQASIAVRTRHGDGFLNSREARELPAGCIFQRGKTVLKCRNRTTENFTIPSSVTNLDMAYVTGGGLDVSNIHRLTWQYSQISDLNAAIQNTQKLVYMDLAFNNITNLQDGQFTNYLNLTHLNLSYNSVNDLPRYVFKSQVKLRNISMSHNDLKAVPFEVFSPMAGMKHLDLSYNHLVTFLDHYFKFNKNIEVLLLNNNNITKITSNALADLTELRILNLSHNSLEWLSRGLFEHLGNLKYLNLASNPLTTMASGTFRNLMNLEHLNLSGNNLTQLSFGLLHFSPNLISLTLDRTKIEVIHNSELLGVSKLQILNLRNNSNLVEIETYVLADTPSLRELDISGNALSVLPQSISNLTHLHKLNISNNPWACDCRMSWFVPYLDHKPNITLSDLTCGPDAYPDDMLITLKHLHCTPPVLKRKTPTKLYRLRSNALLDCEFEANPPPSLTWVTPRREVFHWNPDPIIPNIFIKHPTSHDQLMIPLRVIPPRIQVLDNGSLWVRNVTREDCGRYICYANNPIANSTEDVLLHIDPTDWNHIRIISLIVGTQSAAGFLGLTLLIQFLRYILNK